MFTLPTCLKKVKMGNYYFSLPTFLVKDCMNWGQKHWRGGILVYGIYLISPSKCYLIRYPQMEMHLTVLSAWLHWSATAQCTYTHMHTHRMHPAKKKKLVLTWVAWWVLGVGMPGCLQAHKHVFFLFQENITNCSMVSYKMRSPVCSSANTLPQPHLYVKHWPPILKHVVYHLIVAPRVIKNQVVLCAVL